MGILAPVESGATPKPLVWIGSSKKDLMALPPAAVDVFGYGLYLAQIGKRHDNSRVLRGFGDASVVELLDSRAGSTYRAVYTVRFAAAILYCTSFRRRPSTESPLRGKTWN